MKEHDSESAGDRSGSHDDSAPEVPVHRRARSEGGQPPATILVVDDLGANRQVLVSLLRAEGHRLFEAADGRAGLEVVRAERPELVITDLLMPVMDGYEFVRQLRLEPGRSRTPIVFYTADYSRGEARALAQSAGVSSILMKPADPDEVLAVVNHALSCVQDAAPNAAVLLSKTEFDRQHLRLLTDKLSETAGDLRAANARLRALNNVGLELACEKDPDRLLRNVCQAARDLFGATYVTLGIVGPEGRTLERVETCGTDPANWFRKGDPIAGVLASVVGERRTVRGSAAGLEAFQFPANHPEVQTFIAAPVASPANVYGWFCLVGNEGRAFSEEDEDLVVTLAGQVGRIYENTHLRALSRARAAELEHEVSQHRLSDVALRQERDRTQRYFDTAGIVLLALDLEGRVTQANRFACTTLGWTAEELTGRSWIDTCIPAASRDQLRPRFAELLAGQLPVFENAVLTRSGEQRVIDWRNAILRDDAGQVIGTFSSGTDITARQQAVEALRAGEERTRFALESANVGIWDIDYVTGVVRWSETIEAHYGLAAGTFEGTFDAFVERIHPEDRAATLLSLEEAAKSGADFTLQHRSLGPEGTVRWLNGAGRIVSDAAGRPIRGVGISMDVTARHALELQYQQAQKMEAIGRLAGGVAHDFNNLLTVILGYCELMLDDLPGDDLRRPDIEQIQAAGASASGLTRQLLAFSRKQIIEPALLDVNTVIANMRTMLGRLIGEDVKIVIALSREPAIVLADHGQLEQIVMNLAVNARDAMPDGGTLTIGTAAVELGAATTAHGSLGAGKYQIITVTDTGTGMTPQVMSQLFEPFFTTKDVGKGTGLGLASVHGMVTRSGGGVQAHSEPGQGSTFKVYFPAAAGAAAVRGSDKDAPGTLIPVHTVMLVEDAEELRHLTKRLLERLGHTVVVAANAREAIAMFERHDEIDVVITDVVMPGGSGPQLARQLTARRPELKVIYMSGYTEDAIAHHGVLNPGLSFLHKPFSSLQLRLKIREAFEPSVARTSLVAHPDGAGGTDGDQRGETQH
jgi:PAS domain S-box-containing protein